MKILAYSAILAASLVIFAGSVSAESLVVADFNSGSKPNNLGADFGCWNKDEADKTQGCKDSFDPNIKHGNSGFSMKLDYDVDSPNPAYNGFWCKIPGKDVSAYTKVSFWVKGDESAGFSPSIKLELKNQKGELGRYIFTGVTKDWQEASIPVSQFNGISDLTQVTEFGVVFDDVTCAAKKQGVIYLDDIGFVK